MIFKIVHTEDRDGVSDKSGGLSQKVVPYATYVFEGKEAFYTKVMVHSTEQFENYLNTVGSHSFLFDYVPTTLDKEFEFIHLRIESESVIAPYSSLYVMNDEGKTVDAVHCH